MPRRASVVQGDTIVDVQFSPASCDWAELRDATLAAESLGFGAVWVYDHLAGLALGGTTMLECFTWLGALAEATSTIELGALVVNVWNREVGTLVSAAASVVRISGRQLHLGIGAGTSPTSRWAVEQHAVGRPLEPEIERRHRRVEQALDLMAREWATDRDAAFETFPLPSPVPNRIVGVNSMRLSEIAGRSADGVNVAWGHPRRDEFLAAAKSAAGDRRFGCTTWAYYDEGLFDPDHPERVVMSSAGIDRLVLADLGRPSLARRA